MPQNEIRRRQREHLFLTNDPNYELEGNISPGAEIEIEGEIRYLEQEEIGRHVDELTSGKRRNESLLRKSSE